MNRCCLSVFRDLPIQAQNEPTTFRRFNARECTRMKATMPPHRPSILPLFQGGAIRKKKKKKTQQTQHKHNTNTNHWVYVRAEDSRATSRNQFLKTGRRERGRKKKKETRSILKQNRHQSFVSTKASFFSQYKEQDLQRVGGLWQSL